MGTIRKNEIFKGNSAIPRQSTIRNMHFILQRASSWEPEKIIWGLVKNLNIRPSHGALNYGAALQASPAYWWDRKSVFAWIFIGNFRRDGGDPVTLRRWSGNTRLLICSCGLSSTQRFWQKKVRSTDPFGVMMKLQKFVNTQNVA